MALQQCRAIFLPLKPREMKNIEKAHELLDKKDVSMRTCWECNPGHEHLKNVGGLFHCFDCGRFFMNGNYFTNEKFCEAEFEEKEPLQTVLITINNTKS